MMIPGIWIVFGVSVSLAFMTQIINKLLINEKYVDNSRKEMNTIQKELKTLSPQSKEFKEKQDKMLDMNMTIMKQQFKPMMVTFMPYIIVFYILGAAFSFAPVAVGSTVHLEVSGDALIFSECLDVNETIMGKGMIEANVSSNDCAIFVNGENAGIDLIGQKQEVNTNVGDVSLNIKPPKQIFLNLPFNLPFFGDKIGWLGTYIMFSFTVSMILNKALKGKYLRKWE